MYQLNVMMTLQTGYLPIAASLVGDVDFKIDECHNSIK